MTMDINYSRLAQMITSNRSTTEIVDHILKDGLINYQIPVDSIPNTKQKEFEGCTALHIVVENLNVEAVQNLLEKNVDFTIQNSTGETALHQAVIKLYFSKTTNNEYLIFIVDAILDAHVKYNVSKNPYNTNGLSHFHVACIMNHKNAISYFILHNTNINRAVNSDSPYVPGYTPIHLTAAYSNFESFKILYDRGAALTLRNANDLSPLHLLIEQNMRITHWTEVEGRFLSVTEKEQFENNKEMIKLVLKKYENNKNGLFDDAGLSYLHVLCTLQNDSDIEEFISSNDVDLQQSVELNSVLWPGYTALHFAATFSIKSVKLLLKYGASIEARSAEGETPFDLCLHRYKVEDISSLIETHPIWKNIVLLDENTSLLELLNAMKSKSSLENFVQKININTTRIPVNSPLWPGFSPLHLAILLADKSEEYRLYQERIRILIKAHACIILEDAHGSTPIHIAFNLRKQNIIEFMLNLTSGVFLDHINNDNISLFQAICITGDIHAIKNMLLGRNTNVNLPLPYDCKFKRFFFTAGSTPLHIAVIMMNDRIASLLIKRGANVLAEDAKGMTPIHRLLSLDYSPKVEDVGRVLFSRKNLKDVVTSFGLSHLHIACWTKIDYAVSRLLNQGADINVKLSDISEHISTGEAHKQLQFLSTYKNFQSIDFALCRKWNSVLNLIFGRCKLFSGDPMVILKAANCTTQFNSFRNFKETQSTTLEMWEGLYGLKPLHVACYLSDVKSVEELLKQGADPNFTVTSEKISWFSLTPLHLLVSSSVREEQQINAIAKLLIDHGGDLTIVNSEGDTAIHQLIIADYDFNRKDVVTTRNDSCGFVFIREQTLLSLLNAHKNFNFNPGSDNKRITHFHASCMCNAVTVVENFLEHGIDINQAIDPMHAFYGGLTPLYLAALHNAKETVDLLIKYGADVNAQNCEGDTPLIFVARYNVNKSDCGSVISSLINAGSSLFSANIHEETAAEFLLKTREPSYGMLIPIFQSVLTTNGINALNGKDGTGFIASAIKDLTKIKDIVKHPLYQAIINSYKTNRVKTNGDTVIHNIVSIRKVAASIQVYTKAIQEFLNIGIDIDQQNIKGQTALHVAASFSNSKAVAALLNLGANINLLCDDKTPFTSHWKNHLNSDIRRLYENDRQIAILFAKHVYKLQQINMDVNKTDQAIEGAFRRLGWYQHLGDIELERLDVRKIGQSNVTWSSFLSETGAIAAFPTMKFIERQMICNVFEKQSFRFYREFPECAGILYMQYRKALKRISLIEPSKEALNWILNFNFPDLCSEHILRFLANVDLVNLIDVNESFVDHVQKRRKIVDDGR